ncbi:MAG: hypothetical protein M3179_04300 [Actinomycetota bacterium]|nr:hypothetical protein [Actinomycetota bacterium]
MTMEQRKRLRGLEGRTIHVSLSDGSRLDNVALVSARGRKVWIFAGGEDVFVPFADVIDAWEAEAIGTAA